MNIVLAYYLLLAAFLLGDALTLFAVIRNEQLSKYWKDLRREELAVQAEAYRRPVYLIQSPQSQDNSTPAPVETPLDKEPNPAPEQPIGALLPLDELR